MKRYVIVGAGVAGITAAEAIRRRDPAGEITLLYGDEPPIFRAALSTYVTGQIDREELWLRPADWAERRRIDLRGASVSGIDTAAKRVASGEDTIPYDALLLATGATPTPSPWPGALVYRTLRDAETLDRRLREGGRTVAVVGGGILAIELAELLAGRGCDVTLLIRGERLLRNTLPAALSAQIEEAMEADGVVLHYGYDGSPPDADLVVSAIGVIPDDRLLPGMTVDATLRVVGHSDVWAAGDCVTGAHRCRTWLTAARMGERAALNMTGEDEPFAETFFNASHVWGRHYAVVGDYDPTMEGAPSVDGDSFAHEWRNGDRLVAAAVIGDLRLARKAYASILRERSLSYRLF